MCLAAAKFPNHLELMLVSLFALKAGRLDRLSTLPQKEVTRSGNDLTIGGFEPAKCRHVHVRTVAVPPVWRKRGGDLAQWQSLDTWAA